MHKQTTSQRCAICGTTEQLLRCAKCKTIYYCSSQHQHMDWPTHKLECQLLARQKNNNKMQQLQQAVAATTLDGGGGNVASMGMSLSGAGVTANCSTAQMMSPMATTQTQQTEQNIWPDVIDNMLAALPPDFGNENELSTSNVGNRNSNSNYNSNGSLANASTLKNGSVGGVLQNYTANLNHIQTAAQSTMPQAQPMHTNNHQQLPQTHTSSPYNNSNQNGQSEKSSSYQIGLADDNFMGNANERRYEDLCRNIINDMNQYGLSVVDDFLGMEKGLKILNEVHRMYNAGVFRDGQLVNNAKTEKDLRTIRGDKITWVKGLEPGCSNVGYLINQIDAVVYRANTMHNNGILGNYNIRERTKAMVACYPGSGSHYVTHVDNPNKDGRVITAIYYLNIDWNTAESGGILRIFPTSSNTVADIAPKFDRLIFFWSDKRNPHEVQPAHRTRYAITVWYFDANEREAALNRCKYQNNAVNQTTASSAATTATGATDAVRTKTNTAALLTAANANSKAGKVTTTTPAQQSRDNAKQVEADSTTTTTITTTTTSALATITGTTTSSSSYACTSSSNPITSTTLTGNLTPNANSCAPTPSEICT